jgi:transcriptional regulator with XRE-family HTH domain
MDHTFGSLLRELRRTAGLSQRDLATKAELDFSYISKIENDRLPPPAADTVVTICKILNVPPEQLLSLTGKIPTEIQQMVSSSPAAQEFLRDAKNLGISDEEWHKLSDTLQYLKKGQ